MASGSSSIPDHPEEETQALLSLFSEDITDWLFLVCPFEGENQEMTEKGGKEIACEESVLDDKELEDFVEKQKNINTKRKMASDLKTRYKWCKSIKEERLIEDIPPVELDRLLGHYYCKY